MTESDQQELLAILTARGEQFLQFFPSSTSKKRKRSTIEPPSRNTVVDGENDEEDEWLGIDTASDSHHAKSSESGYDTGAVEEPASASNSQKSNIVIFCDPSSSRRADTNTKAFMKTFMSSKISKLTSDIATTGTKEKSELDEDEEDIRTNAQNDALLHKLIHTNLLSGSLNTELDLTPAQRRKALQGRVLELTGSAKLGKGEKLVRETERNKAAKRVREGIAEKQREKERRELEEAKNLGNYHPTLKKLYEGSSSKASGERRKRGLGMGVGRFSGGFLKLSREDIQKVEDPSSNSRTRGIGGKFRKRG
ncbi:hypothetical protein BDQ17DRAFT_1389284 [Cyathus striatus]|nr:hypothetical protein BDQ17DRAFT_1389284 [Cyathus striatus]